MRNTVTRAKITATSLRLGIGLAIFMLTSSVASAQFGVGAGTYFNWDWWPQPSTFYDGTFDPLEWEDEVILDQGLVHDHTVEYLVENGNGYVELNIDLHCENGDGTTTRGLHTIAFENKTVSYNPALGPIHNVDFRVEVASLGDERGCVGILPMVYQNGVAYFGRHTVLVEGGDGVWHTVGYKNIPASDFGDSFPILEANHPDFSDQGGVITFGFSAGVSGAARDYPGNGVRIDNWVMSAN